jgi:beta-glucosidase
MHAKPLAITVFILIFGSPLFSQGYEKWSTSKSNSEFEWPEGKQIAISLTFDDARLSQIDHGIPVLDNHDVKATFYISPELMLQRINGWKEAIKQGHEIGNHSIVHPCTGNFAWAQDKALEDYSLGQMSQELDSASRLISEVLNVKPVSFAFPCGQTYIGKGHKTRSYVPLIADKFESGRTWLDEGPNDPTYCDMARLGGMELDGKTFAEVLVLIEQAREHNSWLVLAGHEMNTEGRQTSLLSTLDSLCSYAQDPKNGIWIDNVKNIGRYVSEERQVARDPEMDAFVDDLVSKMTLSEKIGQLNMPCGYFSQLGSTIEEKQEKGKSFTAGTLIDRIGPGGGFFTFANHALVEGPREQANYFNELQKIATEQTRLKIPLLQTEEGTHGLMCSGGTIFPEGPTLGSTWNMDLISSVYKTAAMEARAVGIHQLFTLVIEPNRDPRLGRNQEGYSEDPYLCSRISKTIVYAVQGDDLSAPDKTVAGLCHYPGQSEAIGGLERGAMEISERMLHEIFLPPWEAGITKAGAMGVMATYPTIDGIPAHSSKEILTDLLRDELGFNGLVLSEGNGVNTLVYTGLVNNIKEAAAGVANAGMDVSISFEQGYFREMIENVNEGKVSMETIDRSVRRVLEVKYKLGLFENPFVDPDFAVKVSHTEESQQLALEAARQGIVLLKNENSILPLKKNISSIAVIGPNANDEINQLGDYTSRVILQDITTVLDGIKEKAGKKTKINYVKGCNISGTELNEIEQAVAAAKASEMAIVVVGENNWEKPDKKGTSGEGYDVATLELTGLQKELVRKVVETGTPTIVVLINGRPLAVPWIDEHVPAILEAWCPGEKGGEAVAEILFGESNPSGKISSTFPRHAGQLPVYYNYKPSKQYWLKEGWGNSYADIDPSPLYPFGYGLSYTTFEYSNLEITPISDNTEGSFQVSAEISNTGKMAGTEIVQLYVRDKISSVVRPVKELKGFDRITLEPGEFGTVLFELGFNELKMLDKYMEWVVEPGEFEIMVGRSSADIELNGNLTAE